MTHVRPLAEGDHAEAAFMVGSILMDGQMCAPETTVPDEIGAALQFLFMSAEQGYASAQHALGNLYNFGGRYEPKNAWHIPLTEANPVVAAIWYKKAADQDHPYALRELARLYETGRGVPQDQQEAVRLFRLAAEKGDFEAPKDLERLGVD